MIVLDLYSLFVLIAAVLIGILIIMLILKIVTFLIPPAIIGAAVYFLTKDVKLAGLAFLAIAILETFTRSR
ncbi:MAG: hypothetical protein DRN92_06200 [Thermoproteota archaeon]|nr:MAG: hypothetical protein DRN92_06200 [Candidatus Korarchaeota archaeon]